MKRSAPRHTKMYSLAEKLGVPLPMAVGLMEMLWHFTGENCPQGNIGSISDAAIAEAVSWKKRPAALVTALCECGWLDKNEEHRLIVHDWPDHAEYDVCRRLLRTGKDFLPIYGKSAVVRAPSEKSRGPSAHLRTDSEDLRGSSEHMRASREAKAKALGKGLLNDFSEFQKACKDCGLPFSEADMRLASQKWAFLDFEAKPLAIKGLDDRKSCGEFDDPAYRPLPQNYLGNRLWERPLRAKSASKSKLDRVMEEL